MGLSTVKIYSIQITLGRKLGVESRLAHHRESETIGYIPFHWVDDKFGGLGEGQFKPRTNPIELEDAPSAY